MVTIEYDEDIKDQIFCHVLENLLWVTDHKRISHNDKSQLTLVLYYLMHWFFIPPM